MKTSRREFIQQGGMALSGLYLASHLPIEGLFGSGPSAIRYGLFFDSERLPALQSRFVTDPLFAAFREKLQGLDRAVERKFQAEEVRYNDQLYDIARVANTIQDMAFLYAMTGDEDAAELSKESIRTIMKFPKWDYFLEGGTRVFGLQRAPASTIAVALACDWLGDKVDEEERKEWMTVMGERGCEACFLGLYGMRYKDRVEGWSVDTTSTYFEHRPGDIIDLSNWPTILDRTNLKAVPASALAIGAVAYERAFGPSEKSDRWIEQAEYSVGTFKDLYAVDGSYPENISYGNYTSEHLTQASIILKRFGHANLTDIINWPGFVDFIVGMTMPTNDDPHGIVNFGDAGEGMMSAVPFWIADHFGDRRGQWFGKNMPRDHDMWSVLWYKPEIAEDVPPSGPTLYHSELDWMVMRTGYTPEDLVVAMRSGGPSNHEHADRNSIIVKCFGEPLVVDPYRPPYSYSDPSWMLRTTAGHSSLLINGHGHQYHDGSEGTNASKAVARIVRAEERTGYIYWSSDATPAYGLVDPETQSVVRTVVVLTELPAVIVMDKVLQGGDGAILTARHFAFNGDQKAVLQAKDGTFTIRRPAAWISGAAWSKEGVTCKSDMLPIPEERAVQHPFVDVMTMATAGDPLLVTVLVPHRSAGGGTVAFETSGDNVVNVSIETESGMVQVKVHDSGPIPEFVVS
jgi:hypothetical protein